MTDYGCIRNTVSANWVIVDPGVQETSTEDDRIQGDETDAERKELDAGDSQLEEEIFANAPRKYVWDRHSASSRKKRERQKRRTLVQLHVSRPYGGTA